MTPNKIVVFRKGKRVKERRLSLKAAHIGYAVRANMIYFEKYITINRIRSTRRGYIILRNYIARKNVHVCRSGLGYFLLNQRANSGAVTSFLFRVNSSEISFGYNILAEFFNYAVFVENRRQVALLYFRD